MKWPVILIWFGLTLAGEAREALVRTRDGREVSGEVRLETNRLVLIDTRQLRMWRWRLDDLDAIHFASPAVDFPSEAAPWGLLPDGWNSELIGLDPSAGATRWDRGVVTLRTTGGVTREEGDSSQFCGKAITGDTEIVARVASLQQGAMPARAGLMIRDSLTPTAVHVFAGVAAGMGGFVSWRAAEFGPLQSRNIPGVRVGDWFKLKRRGGQVTLWTSRFGTSWREIDRLTVSLGERVRVGLAHQGTDAVRPNWADFDHVSEGPVLWNDAYPPRLVLTSGSVLMGAIGAADNGSFTVGFGPGQFHVPERKAARVVFQWLPLLADQWQIHPPGLVLTTGEHVNGELGRIDYGRLRFSSVITGLREYDAASEVAGAVFRPAHQQRRRFEIRTTGGSVLVADQIRLGDGELAMDEPALGWLRLPVFDLGSVERR